MTTYALCVDDDDDVGGEGIEPDPEDPEPQACSCRSTDHNFSRTLIRQLYNTLRSRGARDECIELVFCLRHRCVSINQSTASADFYANDEQNEVREISVQQHGRFESEYDDSLDYVEFGLARGTRDSEKKDP